MDSETTISHTARTYICSISVPMRIDCTLIPLNGAPLIVLSEPV